MNSLLLNMLNKLALLAVVMMLIEQTLAASCCCRDDQNDVVVRIDSGSRQPCCRRDERDCCKRERDTPFSSCHNEKRMPSTKPCRCPAGCYGKDAPQGIHSTADPSSLDDQLPVTTISVPALRASSYAASDARSGVVSSSKFNGSGRCILLCRFRL